MDAIPEEWIKKYVDQLLLIAGKLSHDSAMQQIILLRAHHAMDLVKAWRESKER
jgi:hypothetical protein